MKRTMLWAALALFVEFLHPPVTLAEVVADSACPKYAVDIAYFATCEGDRVAKASPPALAAAPVAGSASAGGPSRADYKGREPQNRNRTATAQPHRQLSNDNTPLRATR